MVDGLLLKALALGELPDDPIKQLRVTKCLPYFRIDEQGQVWILGRAGLWLKVPPMKHWQTLVREAHEQLGLCSGDRLYSLLKTRYFWADMRR
jgi:hypothetical protein